MAKPNEPEILEQLQRLSEIEPTAESSRRAVERVHAAMLGPGSQKPPYDRRITMSLKIGAAVAIAAGIAGMVTFVMPTTTGAPIAFADVQEEIKNAQTVTFRDMTQVDGKPEEITRYMIYGNDLARAELPNGNISIVDMHRRKSILLIPKEKKATLFEGFALFASGNFYDKLREAHQDATKRLPDRTINGKKATGFLVSEAWGEFTVWVDPETRLPIRFESTSKDEMGRRVQRISSDFVFGAELDKSLFDVTVPEDFEVTSYGVPQLQPEADAKAESAVIVTPLVGIGPAKFGMSKDEVVKALGEPDRVLPLKEGLEQLEYYSRGFGIGVSSNRGMFTVTCFSENAFAVGVRAFKGKTDKGIGLGAGKAEIVKAYGQFDEEHIARYRDVYGDKAEKPNEETGQTSLRYDALRLRFSLHHDKVYQIHITAPRSEPKP